MRGDVFRIHAKMSAVKQLTITYDAVNESNTFTNGDVINGRVVFEVSKEVTIESFYIKCKGDAKVSWSERRNDRTYHYTSHERYFKLKQYFIQDPSKKGKAQLLFFLTTITLIKTSIQALMNCGQRAKPRNVIVTDKTGNDPEKKTLVFLPDT